MCGIAGIYNYSNLAPVSQEVLTLMCNHMHSRGPDSFGIWKDDLSGIGLAHRRLSILDISTAASQPLTSPYTGNKIVFNGEIYNYQHLRDTLKTNGCRFHTTGDTEVLLYLYEKYHTEMLRHLRGMYSFAIWDVKEKQLFCARDPFGIKPFYYTENGNSFAFASQVKTLLKIPGINSEPDTAGHAGFFIWGSVPEPHTLFKNIKPLGPDSYLLIGSSSKVFNKNKTIFSLYSRVEAENRICSAEQVFESFCDSVKYHMVSDVEVGTFLSSGLDSTMISAVASKMSSRKIRAITAGFKEFQSTERDETEFVQSISDLYGLHQEISWIGKQDFESHFNSIIDKMDQPTIDGINTYLISAIAAKLGLKVVLSGVGGDELLGGYSHFKSIPKLVAITRSVPLAKHFGKLVRKSLFLLNNCKYMKHKSLLEYGTNYIDTYLLSRSLNLPWAVEDLFSKKDFADELRYDMLELEKDISELKNDSLKISYLELSMYMRNQLLRDTDWASMAHSLEIRVPFLDIPFLETTAAFLRSDKNTNKSDIAAYLNPQLPNQILYRRKTGFSIPVMQWISNGTINSSGLKGWAKLVHKNCYNKEKEFKL